MSKTALIGLGLFALVFLFAFNDYQNSEPRTFSASPDWYDDSTQIAQRQGGNFISGDGVTVAGVDDVANNQVDITLNLDDCAASQILKRNAGDTAYECTADDDTPDDDSEVPDTITVDNAGTVDPDAISCDVADDNLISEDCFGDVLDSGEIEDIYLFNTGDVGTGAYDFGGADSVEIPNGTAPTVNAAGEIAVDTTDSQFVYYNAAEIVLSPHKGPAIVIESPADADNFLLGKMQDSITITDIHCIVDPADSAESAVIDIQERNSTGDSPATVDAPITCDNDGAEDDGSLSNGTIDAGDWWSIDIGTVTGTVTQVVVSIYFTIDRE